MSPSSSRIPLMVGAMPSVGATARAEQSVELCGQEVAPTEIKLMYKEPDLTAQSPLGAVTQLKTLFVNGTEISDLTPLKELGGLVSLDISQAKVKDLTPFGKLGGLESLQMWGVEVDDEQVKAPEEQLPELEIMR